MARISDNHRLSLLLRAAAAGRPVEITYECGKDGLTETRVIEIHDAYASIDGAWLLTAYCRLREEKRTFRLDRIVAHRSRRLAWRGPVPRVTPMFSSFGTPTSTAHRPRPRTYTAGGLLISIREGIQRGARLDLLRQAADADLPVEITHATPDGQETRTMALREMREPKRGNNWTVVGVCSDGEELTVRLHDITDARTVDRPAAAA